MSEENVIITPEEEAQRKEQILTKNDPYIRMRIAEMFGKKNMENDYDLEINRLLEYAKGKGAEEVEDILWEVRRLDGHLVTGGFSSDRLRDLSNYIFLLQEKDKVDNSIKKMEGLDGATTED